MAAKITRQQYLRAKEIVRLYESQTKVSYPTCITEDDLQVGHWSIGIPNLSDRVVDDEFAHIVYQNLSEFERPVEWVSLDDLGYISVKFLSDLTMTKCHIDAVLNAVNEALSEFANN